MDKETEDKITDLQGQVDELNRKIEENRTEISVPRVKVFKDIEKYERLRVDKLYASLPINNTSTTTNHLQGEIYLTKIGNTSSLCSFIDGVQKKVNLS